MDNVFIKPNSSFGMRLEALMEQKNIDISKKGANTILAKKMIKNNCLPFLVNDDLRKRTETARTRIEKHRKTDSAESVEGKWLKAYCSHFKCSADYLFGYIDFPTHKENDINNQTGLSANAIKKLLKLYNTANDKNGYFDSALCLDIISNLIESEDFLEILKQIGNADSYAISIHKANEELQKKNADIGEHIRNIDFWIGCMAQCKFEALSQFNKIICLRYSDFGKYSRYHNDFKIELE